MSIRNAAIAALSCAAAFLAHAGGTAGTGPSSVAVHSALGGVILGYDVDQNGTEGLLTESFTLPDGRSNVAVETFDQQTGTIVKIVSQQSRTKNDYVTLGVFGGQIGLVELEQVRGIYVNQRVYQTMNPVGANAFTGTWTPPFSSAIDIITSAAPSQDFSNTAVLGFKNGGDDFASYVFSSDVGANTFGPLIRIADPVFDWDKSPVMAIDNGTNQAVLGGSHGCYGCPTEIGLVDLATGTQSSMPGLGKGFVNGIAVDSESHIACTSTEDDFRVEFYDLVAGTSTIVVLPGAINQAQSGGAVAVDPIHKLFLVGQTVSSTAASGSSIQVFDETGSLIGSVNGLHLPASPAFIALNPTRRTGYVIVTPALTSLQSFTY